MSSAEHRHIIAKWSRAMSSFIVRHAPCFWCSLCSPPLDVNATDRAILFRLNTLIMFLSSCQIFSGSAVFVIFFLFNQFKQDSDEINKCINNTISYEDTDFNSTSDRFLKVVRANTERVGDLSLTNDEDNYSIVVPTIWNLIWIIFLLGIIGLVIFIFSFFAIKTIKEVILAGAMRFYWLLIWMVPFEFFFLVSLFGWQSFSQMIGVHFWSKKEFSMIRYFLCQKEYCEDFLNGISTAETKCKIPVFVFNNATDYEQLVNNWCLDKFNSSNCYDIHNNAQGAFFKLANIFFGVNFGIGIFLLILIVLTILSLKEVISTPILQRSQLANIPAWLSVPIVGSVFMYLLLKGKHTVIADVQYSEWIALLYLVSAGTFFIATLLSCHNATSVMNRADKKRKQISVILFILAMMLSIIVLVAIFVTSLVMLWSYTSKAISNEEWYELACNLDTDLKNCETCSETEHECPQWKESEVLGILRTTLKQSTISAFIFLMYAFHGVGYGFVLREHIATYQIDYV